MTANIHTLAQNATEISGLIAYLAGFILFFEKIFEILNP